LTTQQFNDILVLLKYSLGRVEYPTGGDAVLYGQVQQPQQPMRLESATACKVSMGESSIIAQQCFFCVLATILNENVVLFFHLSCPRKRIAG